MSGENIATNDRPINDTQQIFTREEVEKIVRELERTRLQEQENRYNGSELPLSIQQALDETPTVQLKENFKSYKKSIQKYNNDIWNKPEHINKEFINDLKQWKVDASQLVNTIYKITETTRIQARASTEIYEQLQYLSSSSRTAFNTDTDKEIFLNTIQQAERLAVFGFGSAKFQDQEAREVAIKALKLPASIKHLEPTETEEGRTRNSFDVNFVEQVHKARFEQRLLHDTANRRGGFANGYRGNFRGRGAFRGNQRSQQHFYGRGRGRGTPFSQQQSSAASTTSNNPSSTEGA